MNEYLNVIRNNYANFTGRARRHEYWMFQLFNFIAIIIIEGIVALLGALGVSRDAAGVAHASPVVFIGPALLIIYALAMVVPTLAVTVRRLHDAGYSGWLYLVTLTGIGGIVIFVFTVLDSTPGSNKWGPNPKGVQAPVNAF